MNEEQEEISLQLTKYSKGYGWEIKILGLDIDKLEKINNEMKKKFIDDEKERLTDLEEIKNKFTTKRGGK